MIVENSSTSYYQILNSLQEVVWVCSPDFSCVFFNRMALEYFGEEGQKNPTHQFFHPDDYSDLKLAFSVSFDSVEPFAARIRLRRKDGNYFWHYLRMNPVEQRGDLWLNMALNIEARVAQEKELERSRETLESVLENSPEIILINNYETNEYVYTNKGLDKILGFSAEFINSLGERFFEEYIHPEDIPKVKNWLERAAVQATDRKLLHRIKDINGEWHWVTMKSVVFKRTETGHVQELLSYLSDVTFLKETEEKLQESLNFVEQITSTSPDLILVYDEVGEKVVYANQVYCFLGYLIDTLKSKEDSVICKIIYPEDQKVYLEFREKCRLGQSKGLLEVEYRIFNVQGELCWIRERGRVFSIDDQGGVSQTISIIQDITESKKAEERHRENTFLNKLLEKKDEFMSVASHELKTPITTMKAVIQIVKRLIEKHTDEKTLLIFIGKANQQVNKLTSLISDLLDNAKIQAGKMLLSYSSFSVKELLEDCASHMTDHHEIKVFNSVVGEIEGDRIRIEQVLINFLSNAIKYSPEGKEIIVRAGEEGGSVKISVTDFGIGIPEEKIPHVFDRFYRVDNKSQEFSGLGLGLYIAAEIIKQHGGEYGLTSAIGNGSTFWFTIPVRRHKEVQM
ncbi:PAS domain S-box protein [Desertivirga arenae]|uniref:PAS domain S-box protein n=1 Tax=Desertivirga arenae TaxID=2810309 RepID=UPI001A97620B|nr:PAS domain S-box protein [Pedobacter sp. SYSU D00823]